MSDLAGLNSPAPSDPIVATDVSDLVTAVQNVHNGVIPIHGRVEKLADDTHAVTAQPQAWPEGVAFQHVIADTSWPGGGEDGIVVTVGVGTGAASIRQQWHTHHISSGPTGPYTMYRQSSSSTAWQPWVTLSPVEAQHGARLAKIREVDDPAATAWTTSMATVFAPTPVTLPQTNVGGGPHGEPRMDFSVAAHFTNVPAGRVLTMRVGHDPGGGPTFPGVRNQVLSAGTGTRKNLILRAVEFDVAVTVNPGGQVALIVQGQIDSGSITPAFVEVTAKLYQAT